MSFSSSTTPSAVHTKTSSNFNEKLWVTQIRKTLEEELEEDHAPVPVSIFSVPTTLISITPDAYIPQQIAIGPYHHWRQELYEMERYKIAAARRIIKNLRGVNNCEEIADQIHNLQPRIRACYHKYINLTGETLAWMMTVDVCFLLEFLEVYAIKEGNTKVLTRAASKMSNLIDSAGRKSAHIAILRDVLMLENQVPLFLLRKMLEFQYESLEAADDMLFSMLKGLSKELFPFKTPDSLPIILIHDSAHVLDFFYRLLMPKAFAKTQIVEDEEGHIIVVDEKGEEIIIDEESHGYLMKFLHAMWDPLSKNLNPLRLIKALLNSKPLQILLKMPWQMISKIPVLSTFKEPLENLFMGKEKDDDDNAENDTEAPLIEELTIPSVTVLAAAGVSFVPTEGGITSTKFDVKTHTLSLPRVNLDVNTEIIMRNMVAYEACHRSGALIFTRYTEFMNGIVDTEEDAKLLREKGIIMNRLKSDEEVANLWNGMSRSVKLTKVPYLDKVIEDVNKYYNGRWRVKAEKCIKTYIYGSWRLLTVLACIALLGLMAVQAVCSVYSCSRVLTEYASAADVPEPDAP